MDSSDFYLRNKVLHLTSEIPGEDLHLTLKEILEMDNTWWEQCHGHIQWVFPTNKKSQFNLNAPMLEPWEAEHIRLNATNLFKKSLKRFFDFLYETDMSKLNHNHLRITRCIESTALILGQAEAFNFHQQVIHILMPYYDDNTLYFWNMAVYHKFL